MKQLIFGVGILLTGLLPLFGQSEPDGKNGKRPARSAWFVCTSKPVGLEDPVKVLIGEELREVKLPKFMASEPVKVPKDGLIRIVRTKPSPEDATKVEYAVLAQAKVSEGVREALVILTPLPKPDGDLLFASNVQDLAGFKGGDRFFINLSETPIRVTLGQTVVTVGPQKADIYQSPALAKPVNMPIIYSFYHRERKEWKLLSASTVVLRPTRRELFVFNEGSRIGNIKKHKILFPVAAPEP